MPRALSSDWRRLCVLLQHCKQGVKAVRLRLVCSCAKALFVQAYFARADTELADGGRRAAK